MDQVTFRCDTVLSDVHLLLPNSSHLMVRLNVAGQPVFISQFKILRDCEEWDGGERAPPADRKETSCEELDEREVEGEETEKAGHAILDEDGDLDVVRRPRDTLRSEGNVTNRDKVYPTILSKAEEALTDGEEEEEDEEEEEEDKSASDIIKIEHTMATPLEDVGKQVWRGAFLMADFILSQKSLFKGATVLELGAGTGLTSLVMGMVAKRVYCTDVGHDLLSMCQRNITLNCHLLESTGGDVRVRELDWLRDDFCTDANTAFSWSEEEVADLHDKSTFLIAADVCYDDDLTDSLFRTLYRITSNLRSPSTIYLSIEKRLNFTIRHMDVSCQAYDHFRHCLRDLRDLTGGRMGYTVELVETPFPQFFQYERIEQLELWKVVASPL